MKPYFRPLHKGQRGALSKSVGNSEVRAMDESGGGQVFGSSWYSAAGS